MRPRVASRNVNRVFTIIFLLLSLAVATREIPELANLADYPSNDAHVFNYQRQAATQATNALEKNTLALPAGAIVFANAEEAQDNGAARGKTGRDVLRLLGSLRT